MRLTSAHLIWATGGRFAIRAAAQDLGVVAMDRFLVCRELESGELIDHFLEAVDNGYFFVCAERRWVEPVIAAARAFGLLVEHADATA